MHLIVVFHSNNDKRIRVAIYSKISAVSKKIKVSITSRDYVIKTCNQGSLLGRRDTCWHISSVNKDTGTRQQGDLGIFMVKNRKSTKKHSNGGSVRYNSSFLLYGSSVRQVDLDLSFKMIFSKVKNYGKKINKDIICEEVSFPFH